MIYDAPKQTFTTPLFVRQRPGSAVVSSQTYTLALGTVRQVAEAYQDEWQHQMEAGGH
jgi:hypothetical protein